MDAHRFTAVPDWFETHTLGPNIHRIREKYYRHDYRCNVYAINGRERDLVIDTGLGLASVKLALADIVRDPILLCSHAHYDHVGGNFEFPERLMHPAEAHIMDAPTHFNTYAHILLQTADFSVLPWDGFHAADWIIEPAPATRTIGEGDVIDLGDRQFQVLHAPGHSWGSIALWEPETGILFSTDVVYEGEIFDELSCSHIPSYLRTMQRLRELPVSVVYPGHGEPLDRDQFTRIIDTYIKSHAK